MFEQFIRIITESFKRIIQNTFTPFKNMAIGCFDLCFSKGAPLANAFENPILKALLFIANLFSWIVFAYAMLFYLLKIVQEERRNWAVIMRCPMNTIFFILLNQTIAQLCFLLPYLFIEKLGVGTELGMVSAEDFLDGGAALLGGQISLIVITIAIIAFLIITIMRVGAMTIQILTAPFYVSYALMGENQKVMEWIVGTISVGLTYIIQYLVFYGGVLILTYAGKDIISGILGFGLIFATFMVPKRMQKFGWSSGAGHSFQSTYMGGNMLISGAKMLTRRR